MKVIMFTRNVKGSWGVDLGRFYKTNLIQKDNHPPLKSSKSNSLSRLSSPLKNFTHGNQLERFDDIIQDQIKESIVEKVHVVCE